MSTFQYQRVCIAIINRMALSTASISQSENVFKSSVNPVTGKMEWIKEDAHYDFHQETARSGYADMLHDHERNVMFEQALKNVIHDNQSKGIMTHVLDIGTGTGLLSMAAARAGADRVTAIEVFEPMARVAKQIIHCNGQDHKINLFTSRSTDLSGAELSDKPNICVAELFDTELIGEGALRSFKEAHEKLLAPNSRVIPASARVWVQPIQSDAVLRYKQLNGVNIAHLNISIHPTPQIANCSGAASVHDVQMDQIDPCSFQPVGAPIEVFRFDFEHPETYEFDEVVSKELSIIPNTIERIDAVFMWWDLDMDGTGNIILTMKPNWDINIKTQWRDHWMQAIYYLPQCVNINPSAQYSLICKHDEYSLSFDVVPTDQCNRVSILNEPPVCTCMLHVVCSRSNIARLNDTLRQHNYSNALKKLHVDHPYVSQTICIGDCELLPLIAAQIGLPNINTLCAADNSIVIRKIMNALIDHNGLSNKIKLLDSTEHLATLCNQTTFVIAEPFYFASIQPWHDLHFWYAGHKFKERNPDSIIMYMPMSASLYCMPVQFDNLHKIRAPVGKVLGFDLSKFDELVQSSIKLADTAVEPHSLWEYPSTCAATARPLIHIEFDKHPDRYNKTRHDVVFELNRYPCNGVVFWMNWQLVDGIEQSCGLMHPCSVGDKPKWDICTRQGVYFMNQTFGDRDKCWDKLNVTAVFDSSTCEFDVKCDLL